MTTEEFKFLALSFPGTEEKPHFDRTAFKVVKRRIFATLHEPSRSANIVLSPFGQSEFCRLGEPGIHPVPNKWGEKGWTTFELDKVPADVVQAALEMAYEAVFLQGKKKR
ncbi:MAG: MmcQ/YjbR family DNA-binding protein [Phaeodactylibacter sp.]|nr:MmcQ/YjbR family DNA-binding protein [Phaeodactylibacter sp.]